MKELPKISIVTPSFNQGAFIEETICSVLDQGYENLEYVIIDGGSTDETVEIIKKYAHHLNYWISEPDKGQTDAIIKGMKHCTGDVFNWLNSDDVLVPHVLHQLAEVFDSMPEIDLVSGTEIHFSEDGKQLKFGTKIYPSLEQNLFHSVFYQPSTFWRMSAIKNLKLNEHLHYLMDTDLWMQYLLLNGSSRIVKLDYPIARFRLHDQSKSVSSQPLFNKERWSLRLQLVKQINCKDDYLIKLALDKSADYLTLSDYEIGVELNRKEIISMLTLRLFKESYFEGDFNTARRLFRKAWKYLKLNWKDVKLVVHLFLIPRIRREKVM